MMSWRRQLPVYSPLDWHAVLAGVVGGDARLTLRQELLGRFGAPDLLLTDGGTTALALALHIAGAARGGLPVALPAYGCFDLATAALTARLPVVLYDVDPHSLLPDWDSLLERLRAGVAAVVIVHQYGLPVPMDLARALADEAGALLIEDAAQGVGGEWKGLPLGAHGDLGVLSFGRGKGQTGGGGGALLLGAAALPAAEAAAAGLERADAGRTAFAAKLAAQWLLGRPAIYGLPASLPSLRLGETVFRPPEPLRAMHPASAAVLRRTLTLSEGERLARVAHATRLLAHARARGLHVPAPASTAAATGWLRLPLLAPGERGGNSALARAARLGVMPGYPIALDELPALAGSMRAAGPLPGAHALAARLWTLPTHSLLEEADLRRIEQWMDSLARP